MRRRSWNWLRKRIFGLLTRPGGRDIDGRPIPANRLQADLLAKYLTDERPEAAAE